MRYGEKGGEKERGRDIVTQLEGEERGRYICRKEMEREEGRGRMRESGKMEGKRDVVQRGR